MTKLMLRRFVPNYEQKEDPKVRSAVGRLSGIVGIVCNVFLFIGKLLAGILSGSVSITADAMNNLTDASSSIVTLIGFKLAERPADEKHPYGHARFEYLSGLAVSAMIIVIGIELAQTSIGKIFRPEPISFSWLAGGILLVSILVKLWMSKFSGQLGAHIDSAALLATAADSRNDCVSTGAVLVAAVVEMYTGWSVDGYVGLVVALFVLGSGAGLAKETISPLLGESASPELQKRIVDYIESNPMVLGYHDLMVHDYGPGQRFATLHAEMDSTLDPLICHEAIDDMERECLESHGVHLVIHYDPIVTNDPDLNRIHGEINALLQKIDPRTQTHDFRMVKGDGHTNLIFDAVLPSELMKKQTQIKEELQKDICEMERGTYYLVVTFDQAGFNQEAQV